MCYLDILHKEVLSIFTNIQQVKRMNSVEVCNNICGLVQHWVSKSINLYIISDICKMLTKAIFVIYVICGLWVLVLVVSVFTLAKNQCETNCLPSLEKVRQKCKNVRHA